MFYRGEEEGKTGGRGAVMLPFYSEDENALRWRRRFREADNRIIFFFLLLRHFTSLFPAFHLFFFLFFLKEGTGGIVCVERKRCRRDIGLLSFASLVLSSFKK